MCRGSTLGGLVVVVLAGCGGAASGTRPEGVTATSASIEVRALREQNRRQRQRIDELLARQGVLEAQVRRLRRGDETADETASDETARPVLRAGPQSPGRGAETRASDRSRRRRGADATAPDEGAPPDVTAGADEASEDEAADDGGPRPILRIHGGSPAGAIQPQTGPPAQVPDGPPIRLMGTPVPTSHATQPDASMMYAPVPQAPMPMPLPMLPPGLPSSLSRAPVPDIPLSAITPAAPAPAVPSAHAAAVPEYQVALRYVRERRFDDAIAALSIFLERHPEHPYADNALYWRAEVHYARRAYRDAIRDFASVVERYPQGNKVPDALLKIGLSYARLGDTARSRAYLERVVREFPGSSAAAAARREVPR